jgi:hypothetical protein
MAMLGQPIYNVTGSVGRGGANAQTDVMLIQYFIFNLIVSPSPTWRRQQVFPGLATAPLGGDPTALFPFNGVAHKDLGLWIETFQRLAPQHGFPPMTTDGRVSPMPSHWGDRARHHGWFTIQTLNQAMARANPEAFTSLVNEPDVPGPLKRDLNVARLTKFKA